MKLIAALTLFFVSHSCFAQVSAFNVTWGDKIKTKRKYVSQLLLTEGDVFYATAYARKISKKGMLVERYENMQPDKYLIVENKRSGAIRNFNSIYEFNKQIYVGKTTYSPTENRLVLDEIDKESMTLFGDDIEVFEDKASRSRKMSQSDYQRLKSNNDEYLGFVVYPAQTKKEKRKFSFKIFDQDMEAAWEADIKLPYVKEDVSVYSSEISSDGSILMVLKVYKDLTRAEKRKQRGHDYYIYNITEEGIVSKHQLELDKDQFIVDLDLAEAEDGSLLCSGFYGRNHFFSTGVFYMRLNPESYEIDKLSIKEFDDEFLKEGFTERQEKKFDKRKNRKGFAGLSNISLRDLIVRDDGGAVLVGEYVHIYTTTSVDANGNRTTTTHYRYNNIYVININPEGEIDWSKKIFKYQYSQNDGGFYSGFFMAVKDDKLYFMFNDHAENDGLTDPSEIRGFTRKPKQSVMMLVSMENDGSHEREILIPSAENNGLLLRPKMCRQMTEDGLLLYAYGRKYNRFATVKID